MPTKIRLQRHGKKKYAFYHVVVADGRAPRDGKFIEKLGTYNPNHNPATIDINFDRALYWVSTGAQPSDTAKALLSYKGVMHKDHLNRGVLKGALTQEQADKKFENWLKEKEGKVDAKIDNLAKASETEANKRMAAEKETNAKRAADLLAKQSALTAEAEAATAQAEAPETEDPAAEATETAPSEEAPEVKAEEVPTEEKKEEVPAEAKAEETPAAEAKKEDVEKTKE